MAPKTRLSMIDRPALRFRRKGITEHMEVDVQFLNRPSEELPSLALLDNRSFINLFENFQDLVTKDDSTNLRDMYSRHPNSSARAPSQLDALHSHGNTTAMTYKPKLSPVARGDSTASSSSSVPTDNETFSRNSRRSSKSSFTPASDASPVKIIAAGRWKANSKRFLASPTDKKSRHFQLAMNLDSPSSAGPTSGPEKPLPAAPFFDLGSVFAAVGMELEEGQGKSAAESRPKEPTTPTRPSPRHRHAKSASMADCPTLSAERMEYSPSSGATSRGARLGNAIAKRGQRPLSPSSTSLALDLSSHIKPRVAEPKPSIAKNTHSTLASIHAADVVRYEIMRQLDDLKDLQSAAMVSRRFYGTFKRHESPLVGLVLRAESAPAWEMLQIVLGGEDSMSTRAYSDYRRTLDTLRMTIVMQCEVDLSAETFAGLIGSDMQRRERIDRALWRIWIFCEIFGKEEKSQHDVQAQIDWLKGGKAAQQKDLKSSFGRGNGDGLSIVELEDLSEMWHCMGLVLQGFRHRVDEALLAGILNQCTIDETHTEAWYLSEWIQHLLCLGPPVISSISSCSFDHANALGLTTWTAPTSLQESRGTFLKAAITVVYQERVVAEATLKAAQMSLPVRASRRLSKTEGNVTAPTYQERTVAEPAVRADQSSVQLRPARRLSRPDIPVQGHETQPHHPPTINTSSEQMPLAVKSIKRKPIVPRPRVISAPLLSTITTTILTAPPEPQAQRSSVLMSPGPGATSTMFHSLSMTPTASTRMGPTLFPVENPHRRASKIPILPLQHVQPPPQVQQEPDEEAVIDPVDKAMAKLVNDLGFTPADAKRALASTDTGFGMDIEAAIHMLNGEAAGTTISNVGTSRARRRVSASASGTRSPVARTNATLCENCGCSSPTQRLRAHNANPSPTLAEDSEAADSLGQLVLKSCASPPTTTVTSLMRKMSNAKAYQVLGVNTKRSNSGKAKAGRLGSMRAKTGGQLVKTLTRGVGTVKMPRVSLGLGVNMNLVTMGMMKGVGE